MTDRPSLRTVSISNFIPGSNERLDFEINEATEQPIIQSDRYAIGELIGKGGMGLVYQAYDNVFDREVAVKVLLQSYQHRDEARERFLQEARTTARLQHPGIVSVYDMGLSDDAQPYFAMKLVRGRTLSEIQEDSPRSGQERARLLDIFAKVCRTVAYAHSSNTVHLDVKPSNVMVGAFGEVHLMDWGLSRQLGKATVHLKPISPAAVDAISDEQFSAILSNSKIIGTPSYMAPEQARGQHIGVRADVFGLGALLCEILTGAPPYEGNDFRQIYRRAARGALHDTYQRLDNCEADRSITKLAKRCLARSADDRPSDAGIIAEEIISFIESSMERAERDLRRFFEISSDLFCVASLDGYFKRVSSNFTRVLGYSNHQLISQPFIEFIHPDDMHETTEAVKTLADGKPIAEFRNRYRDADGQFWWFEWTAKSIPEDNLIFAVARVVDPKNRKP